MNFVSYQNSSPSFKRVISIQNWANEVKAAEKVESLKVTNILQGESEDARYVIVTLADGRSTTFPASKKAAVGEPVTSYYFGENEKGEWIVVTGATAPVTTL